MECDAPNEDLYKFDGSLTLELQESHALQVALDTNQVLLRVSLHTQQGVSDLHFLIGSKPQPLGFGLAKHRVDHRRGSIHGPPDQIHALHHVRTPEWRGGGRVWVLNANALEAASVIRPRSRAGWRS